MNENGMTGEEIANAINKIIDGINKNHVPGGFGAINWGNLRVREVSEYYLIYPYAGRGINVLIAKAEPGNWLFCETIETKFRELYGFGVEVRTEW